MNRRRNRLLSFLLAALTLPALLSLAVPAHCENLSPTRDQLRATALIVNFIQNHHFRKTALDDTRSAEIFDRYLEALDPGRSYLLASDVERYARYRHRFDDLLREGKLEPAFQIFETFRRRLRERGEYAISLLDDNFDFQRDEDFVVDRSKLPWAANRAELDDIWRKRVKNDYLNLKLAGQEREAVVDTLRKRYEHLIRRASQFNEDDVYQLFINAYATSVEPHTAYLSPRTSENFQISMRLSLEGIGAALQNENEFTVVKRIIPGGPADLSGLLHVEDRITAVGQGSEPPVDVVGWRLDDVVDLIRGPKNSVVKLEVLPKGTGPDGTRKVITLVRDTIKLEEQAAKKSVIETSTGKRIGVIDIPTFYEDVAARGRGDDNYRSTTRDVRGLLKELQDEGVAGIVIDLRGDGGGSLTEAIELTGLFIKSGPVVQVKNARGRMEVYDDPDPQVVYQGPLAVLVDRYSASASEIFAGAMQDYGRGVILGEATFGKGTVQSLLDLSRFARGTSDDLGQLKTTIAQFFRVSGASTQHRGVVPDILFPSGLDADDYGERAFDNALPWAAVRPAKFEMTSISKGAVAEARRRHEVRIQKDAGFHYLVSEGHAQQVAMDQKAVSLLEARRRAERDALEEARRERVNELRVARGLKPLDKLDPKDPINPEVADEDTEEKDPETDLGDVWLEEAAQILADLIDIEARPPRSLQAAGWVPPRLPDR